MRRLLVLAILLSGCSKGAAPSRSASRTASKQPESLWRPAPDPEPKAPPPPAKVEVPPPPDPAAEARRAEAARREDENRRQRNKEREFARLPSPEKRRIVLTGDALNAKGLGHISNADLIVINAYPLQFPSVSPADLAEALAAYGDRKGAREHLASLAVTDPAIAIGVRAAFGLASEATCKAARAVSEEIGRIGQGRISESAKSFVAHHPSLFPAPAVAKSSPGP